MTKAIIIEHSEYDNEELISIELMMPKFLDAEFEKHRSISSNSSSDRAIPIRRMIDAEHFLPSDVRLNESGMSGEIELTGFEKEEFLSDLSMHRELTCQLMEKWKHIHKQTLNRYHLPFSYQTKIATCNKDSWDYFLSLRLHKAADPAIYKLAQCINDSISNSSPHVLDIGEWHLPYVGMNERLSVDVETAIKISSARCARTSYNNHYGDKSTIEEDVKLYNFLIKHLHLTPLEHQATPMRAVDSMSTDGISHINQFGKLWSGNFHNFIQHRKVLEDNNWKL